MYSVYGNSGRYIHGVPLFEGGPLLGGSVIEGSTVFKVKSTVFQSGHGDHSRFPCN